MNTTMYLATGVIIGCLLVIGTHLGRIARALELLAAESALRALRDEAVEAELAAMANANEMES